VSDPTAVQSARLMSSIHVTLAGNASTLGQLARHADHTGNVRFLAALQYGTSLQSASSLEVYGMVCYDCTNCVARERRVLRNFITSTPLLHRHRCHTAKRPLHSGDSVNQPALAAIWGNVSTRRVAWRVKALAGTRHATRAHAECDVLALSATGTN